MLSDPNRTMAMLLSYDSKPNPLVEVGAAHNLSFSSKPLFSKEDDSFLVFGGTTRLLGLVVDCGGTWEAYPWHRLNSRCEPEDVNRNLGEFEDREAAIQAIVDEAKSKGRWVS